MNAPPARRGRPPIEMTGRTFGRLTVLERAGRDPRGKITWRCSCECGNPEFVAEGDELRRGKVRSCGCLRRETARAILREHHTATAQWRQDVVANLASLNEIIAELTAVVSVDKSFTELVQDQLRDHSWALGCEFRDERPPAGWEPSWRK